MPTHPNPDPETWLTRLNGDKPTPEADLIRKLIQANPTPTPALTQHKQETFISELRRQAAFAPQKAEPGWLVILHTIFTNFQGHGVAVMATVAVLGIGLSLTWRIGIEPSATVPAGYQESDIVMRGDEQAQRLITPNPRALANRISEVLARHQLPLRRVENGPLVQIQAKVPAGHPARDELTKLGVHVPTHGRMNLLLVQG